MNATCFMLSPFSAVLQHDLRADSVFREIYHMLFLTNCLYLLEYVACSPAFLRVSKPLPGICSRTRISSGDPEAGPTRFRVESMTTDDHFIGNRFDPPSHRRIIIGEVGDGYFKADHPRFSHSQRHSCKRLQLFGGTLHLRVLRGNVQLHDLFSCTLSTIGDRERDLKGLGGSQGGLCQVDIAIGIGRIAESKAKGEGRDRSIAFQLAVSMPEVVGDRGSIAIKERQLWGMGREGAGQFSARIDTTEQNIRKSSTSVLLFPPFILGSVCGRSSANCGIAR
jgi:hypothetical protein